MRRLKAGSVMKSAAVVVTSSVVLAVTSAPEAQTEVGRGPMVLVVVTRVVFGTNGWVNTLVVASRHWKTGASPFNLEGGKMAGLTVP